MSKIILCANYRKIGQKLISTTHTFLISKRKKITKNKPRHFLMQLDPKTNKGLYISSLYPVSENQYTLDFKGVRYSLEITKSDDSAIIFESTF